MSLLEDTVAAIGSLAAPAMAAARRRQGMLTKPPGSLGRLEELAIWLAGVTGEAVPRPLEHRAVVAMAGDQGVSAYPSAVTAQMVRNFAAGGAAINALAQGVGARVVVADLGVAADLSDVPDLRHHAIAPGTRDMARGPGLLTRSSLNGYTWRFHGLSHNMRRTRNTGDHVATCYAFCLGRLP